MKLYEMANDVAQLTELSEVEDVREILDIIYDEIESKSGNVIRVVKTLESDIKQIDEEVKRLQALKKAKNNNIKNLKNYVMECMEVMGEKKIQTPIGNMSIRNNQPSLIIENECDIPGVFITEEIVKNIDNAKIKETLKNGIEVPGATLVSSKSLTIR